MYQHSNVYIFRVLLGFTWGCIFPVSKYTTFYFRTTAFYHVMQNMHITLKETVSKINK